MDISDLPCDLYDIREMGKLCGFGKLPKDNEGTSMTIDEVLENAIKLLSQTNENGTTNRKTIFGYSKFEKYGTYTINARSKEHAIHFIKRRLGF